MLLWSQTWLEATALWPPQFSSMWHSSHRAKPSALKPHMPTEASVPCLWMMLYTLKHFVSYSRCDQTSFKYCQSTSISSPTSTCNRAVQSCQLAHQTCKTFDDLNCNHRLNSPSATSLHFTQRVSASNAEASSRSSDWRQQCSIICTWPVRSWCRSCSACEKEEAQKLVPDHQFWSRCSQVILIRRLISLELTWQWAHLCNFYTSCSAVMSEGLEPVNKSTSE